MLLRVSGASDSCLPITLEPLRMENLSSWVTLVQQVSLLSLDSFYTELFSRGGGEAVSNLSKEMEDFPFGPHLSLQVFRLGSAVYRASNLRPKRPNPHPRERVSSLVLEQVKKALEAL